MCLKKWEGGGVYGASEKKWEGGGILWRIREDVRDIGREIVMG